MLGEETCCKIQCGQNYFLKVIVSAFDICRLFIFNLHLMWQPHYDGWWGGASGSWRPCSVAPQWYLWRERKVLLVALVGGSAGNMATLQSHACFLGTAATTITLILKRDPVPEAFSLWCFCADGTLPQVSLMCLCVSLAAMENMLSQRIKLCVKAT